jgi:hypothetical protein
MKTNNRFNVLLETNNNNATNANANKTKINKNSDEPKHSTFNNFKSNGSGYKSSRHQDDVEYRMFKEEKLKKQKEEDIVKALDISNFPDLNAATGSSISKNQNREQYKNSFADMMRNSTQILQEENNTACIKSEEDESVKPGWVCIKQNFKTSQPVWSYGNGGCSKVDETVTIEDPYFVFERLVTQYQKRKNEYIKTWGYEEYDKMFLFQNYDYEYFDKLDENYDDFYKITSTSDYEYSNYNYLD